LISHAPSEAPTAIVLEPEQAERTLLDLPLRTPLSWFQRVDLNTAKKAPARTQIPLLFYEALGESVGCQKRHQRTHDSAAPYQRRSTVSPELPVLCHQAGDEGKITLRNRGIPFSQGPVDPRIRLGNGLLIQFFISPTTQPELLHTDMRNAEP
jgi:hypothetical protein